MLKPGASHATPTKPKTPVTPPILNRYTTLPILLDVLQKKHITLLSPETWEDRNDAYYLERYQRARRLASVLAICFSPHRETFHHWRIFSAGSPGVCIEFYKDRLLQKVAKRKGCRHQAVEYRWITDLNKSKPAPESWPFLKRKPFEDEREYWIIFARSAENLRSTSIPIDISSIKHITLSPWLPSSIASTVIAAVKRVDGSANISVGPSSLLNNTEWRSLIT